MIAVAVLLCTVWVGYSMSSDSGSKAVAAAQVKSKADSNGVVSGLLYRNGGLNDELASKFKSSVSLIEQGEHQTAIAKLNEIIEQQPQAIEPYINLAALYAKSNEIDKASETLKKAIKVNKNTSVLFESLQSLYAAQAALAYQRALEIDTIEDTSLAVTLPTINTLMLDKPNEVDSSLLESNKKLNLEIAESLKTIDYLKGQLSDVEKNNVSLLSANSQLKQTSEEQTKLLNTQSTQVAELSALKSKLSQLREENTGLSNSNTQLRNSGSKQVALLDTQAAENLKELNLFKDRLNIANKEKAELASANAKLQKVNDEKIALLDLQSVKNTKVLETLNEQLNSAQKENASLVISNTELRKKYDQEVAVVASKGSEQSQLVSSLRKDVQQARQKYIELEREYTQKIAALEVESNNRLAVLQSQFDQALLASSKRPVIASSDVVKPVNVVVEQPSQDEVSSEKVAIELVQAWARSWSAQDVSAYIAFYESSFRPNNGISNSKWRAQRKVRLTNKTFIQVTVSNFKVKDKGSQFEVVFFQHYKANNVNDKIFKRLVFNKNGSDWADAKIVTEQVVSG